MALFTKSDLARVTIVKSFAHEDASAILEKASREFSEDKTYDIFISHSYLDAEEILRLKKILEEMGFTTYVDWIQDRQLDRSRVSKDTARILRSRMKKCRSLFFATSESSPNSKWMPWELGYFDGLKQKVAILPISPLTDTKNSYDGQEYLGLYPYITKNKPEGSDNTTIWVHDSSDKYVMFKLWLEGQMPSTH